MFSAKWLINPYLYLLSFILHDVSHKSLAVLTMGLFPVEVFCGRSQKPKNLLRKGHIRSSDWDCVLEYWLCKWQEKMHAFGVNEVSEGNKLICHLRKNNMFRLGPVKKSDWMDGMKSSTITIFAFVASVKAQIGEGVDVLEWNPRIDTSYGAFTQLRNLEA